MDWCKDRGKYQCYGSTKVYLEVGTINDQCESLRCSQRENLKPETQALKAAQLHLVFWL